jgi:hypothetical protein
MRIESAALLGAVSPRVEADSRPERIGFVSL